MQEMQETRDRSMGLEDPLEEGMKTHSSVLAWRISWTEEPGGLHSREAGGSQRVGQDRVTHIFTFPSYKQLAFGNGLQKISMERQ